MNAYVKEWKSRTDVGKQFLSFKDQKLIQEARKVIDDVLGDTHVYSNVCEGE